MIIRTLTLALLLMIAAWLGAADYMVPGTTVELPLSEGFAGAPEIQGIRRPGEVFPLIGVTVMQRLGRERAFKDPVTSTASINGIVFDFTETTKEKDGRKLAFIIAAAKIGEQALSFMGMYEAGNARDKDLITKTIMGARFAATLITPSYQEWLPITFEVIPEFEVLMMAQGSMTLARKGDTVDTGAGMMIVVIRQELTPDERDTVLKATCQQMAIKQFAVKAEDGKVEKTTLGKLPGYRFTVSKGPAAKLPGASVHAVAKDGVTVILLPFRPESADLGLFAKQIAKMKTSLTLRP